MALRDEYNFDYGDDKAVDGITVNDNVKLAKKVKELLIPNLPLLTGLTIRLSAIS